MEIKTNTAEYLVKVKLDSIDIKDDISVICITKESPENSTKTYCYYKTSKLSSISLMNFKKDENLKLLGIMKKEFKDYYKQNGFGLPGYEEIWDKFLYKPKEVFDFLKDDKLSPSDFDFVEVSRYDETFYPFTYGVSRSGFIPHMIRYNGNCYMITNYEYDLEKVAAFLIEKEKEGMVRIRRGTSLFDEGEIICDIPSYNVFREGENKFINFYCFVEDESQKPDDSFACIPYMESLLEPFKIEKDEEENV